MLAPIFTLLLFVPYCFWTCFYFLSLFDHFHTREQALDSTERKTSLDLLLLSFALLTVFTLASRLSTPPSARHLCHYTTRQILFEIG